MIARRALAALVSLVAFGACSVDDLSLEGKQCPCVDDYICNPATNTCQRDPLTIDAPGSDGIPPIDAVDAPLFASCLPGPAGATLIDEDFADLLGWQTRGGTWSSSGVEAEQASTAIGLVYAFPDGSADMSDVRVASRMRLDGGTGSMGLALRVQPVNSGQYWCAWAPTTGLLRLEWTRTDGAFGDVLAMTQVDIGAIPGYLSEAAVVVEAEAVGATLNCCVRDIAGATVTATSTRYGSGGPGLRTETLAAFFDNFLVLQR